MSASAADNAILRQDIISGVMPLYSQSRSQSPSGSAPEEMIWSMASASFIIAA